MSGAETMQCTSCGVPRHPAALYGRAKMCMECALYGPETARMIAAAPEMLQALDALVVRHAARLDAMPELRRAVMFARAALVKARGGGP